MRYDLGKVHFADWNRNVTVTDFQPLPDPAQIKEKCYDIRTFELPNRPLSQNVINIHKIFNRLFDSDI